MKLKISIPESWNECSDSQLKKLLSLIYSGMSGNSFDYNCFRVLVGARWWQIKIKCKLILLFCNVPMTEIKKSFEYIFKENTLTRFPKIPTLNKEQYYGPLDQLSNLTIGELAVADDLHIKWRATNDVECLQYLAAILYVNQQQPRPVFDKNDLYIKGPIFKKLSMADLLVIECAFHGCKEYMSTKFKRVFPKPVEGKLTTNKPKAQSSQFPKLILELSGGKFGTHEQTSRTNCYTFLAEFENLLKNQ